MKKYTKTELKKSFIYLLTGISSTENNIYIDNKKNIDNLFNDFLNLSKKSISVLDERQTYILRKKYGVLDNGNAQTLKTVANEFNITDERVRQILSKIIIKLSSNTCNQSKSNILQEYCKNNLISKLLDCKISYIFDDYIVKRLYQKFNDEMTLRELVNKNSIELKEFDEKELEQIKQTLNYLNLSFSDDISIVKNKIIRTDILKDLIYKFEVDEEYYSVIEDIVNELCNLNLRQVLGLDENKTNILRKVYGILDNGNKPTFDNICNYIGNQNIDNCSVLISNSFNELKSLYNGFISIDILKMNKEQMPLMDIKYFNLDIETYINLRKSGIKTLEQLLELGHNNIECKYNYNKQLIERLTFRLDYLYELDDKKGLLRN